MLQDVNTKLASLLRYHFEGQMHRHRRVVNLPSSENTHTKKIQSSTCFMCSRSRLQVKAGMGMTWAWRGHDGAVSQMQPDFLFFLGSINSTMKETQLMCQNDKDFPTVEGCPFLLPLSLQA